MEYTFNLTESEAHTVLAALGELPAKSSFNLIVKFKEQFDSQSNEDDSNA